MTLSDMKARSREKISQLLLSMKGVRLRITQRLALPAWGLRPQFLNILNFFGSGDHEFDDEVLLVIEESEDGDGQTLPQEDARNHNLSFDEEGRRRYHYGYRSIRTGKVKKSRVVIRAEESPPTPWSYIHKEKFLRPPQ